MFKKITEQQEVVVKTFYICDICKDESMDSTGWIFFAGDRWGYDKEGVARITAPNHPEVHMCDKCNERILIFIDSMKAETNKTCESCNDTGVLNREAIGNTGPRCKECA